MTEGRSGRTLPRWYRSALFVPGNRLDWMLGAVRFEPDALILDLEDAVPLHAKDQARSDTSRAIAHLQDSGIGLFVRLNAWRSGELLDDINTVVGARPTGVVLPKVHQPADVHALSLLIGEVERKHGLPVGRISILPLAETAQAFVDPYAIYRASRRVRVAAAGTSPRGDVNLSIGFEWTSGGEETLYLRSRVIAEARAAGIAQVLGGLVIDVDDLDLVRAEARRSKQLGCSGMMVIHPSHVAVANEVFSPTADEIAEACGVLRAMAEALADGRSAVRHGGQMIDYANARHALLLLARAEQLDLDVPEYPTIDVTVYDGGQGDEP